MTASNSAGYVKFDGTGMVDEILASSHALEKISITIDPAATDPSNGAGTEHLRRGLIMYQPTGSSYYKELDAVPANLDEVRTIVVLGENVEMNAGGAANNEPANALAYYEATFKSDKIFDSTGFTTNTFWNDVRDGVTLAGSGALVARLKERTNA